MTRWSHEQSIDPAERDGTIATFQGFEVLAFGPILCDETEQKEKQDQSHIKTPIGNLGELDSAFPYQHKEQLDAAHDAHILTRPLFTF